MILLNPSGWDLRGFKQHEFCQNYARNSGDTICPFPMDKSKHVLLGSTWNYFRSLRDTPWSRVDAEENRVLCESFWFRQWGLGHFWTFYVHQPQIPFVYRKSIWAGTSLLIYFLHDGSCLVSSPLMEKFSSHSWGQNCGIMRLREHDLYSWTLHGSVPNRHIARSLKSSSGREAPAVRAAE